MQNSIFSLTHAILKDKSTIRKNRFLKQYMNGISNYNMLLKAGTSVNWDPWKMDSLSTRHENSNTSSYTFFQLTRAFENWDYRQMDQKFRVPVATLLRITGTEAKILHSYHYSIKSSVDLLKYDSQRDTV